ncbi:ABC transporter permease subunit [Timonella sp. A28]|uniref:ABC transporter permease subunit n=1 Tax=Timonella sp. A28 TaxID=3442640 RepID=UPI003EBB557C
MKNALASEIILLRSRRVPVMIGALWAVLVAVFGVLTPYLVYVSLPSTTEDLDALYNLVVPASIPLTVLGSYPMFGGAVMLILGVLIAGPEYRWGTWTARFTQGASRSQVVAAKATAGSVTAAAAVLIAFIAGLLVSTVITIIEGSSWSAPDLSKTVLSLLAGTLISVAWVCIGMALAIIFKGTTMALIVGLLWVLGIENIVSGLAQILPWLEPIRVFLPGVASGSIAAALGVATQDAGGTPGVAAVTSGSVAVLVLCFYAVAAFVVARALAQRRDVS